MHNLVVTLAGIGMVGVLAWAVAGPEYVGRGERFCQQGAACRCCNCAWACIGRAGLGHINHHGGGNGV